MSANQTVETGGSVTDFLFSVESASRRADALELAALMTKATGGTEPRMWGPAIVGFGKYRYRYDSGREGEMFRVGFSPRKTNLVLYLSSKSSKVDELLGQLGKYKTGASCLYINRLSDVDVKVLESLVAEAWESARQQYGEPSGASL